MRGEIIWDKSASAGTSTARGSWQSATNPTLRDTHEYILVFFLKETL
jgi:site-specific DNA-methyltransferase (adenine-specific)